MKTPRPMPYTNRPKVVFKDGEVGYVITAGSEQSLVYLPDEQREQYYPNYLFKPFAPMKPRRKRNRMKKAGLPL